MRCKENNTKYDTIIERTNLKLNYKLVAKSKLERTKLSSDVLIKTFSMKFKIIITFGRQSLSDDKKKVNLKVGWFYQ